MHTCTHLHVYLHTHIPTHVHVYSLTHKPTQHTHTNITPNKILTHKQNTHAGMHTKTQHPNTTHSHTRTYQSPALPNHTTVYKKTNTCTLVVHVCICKHALLDYSINHTYVHSKDMYTTLTISHAYVIHSCKTDM